MRAWWAAALALLFGLATTAGAHRLDEYLQAATIALEQDRIEVEIRLAPGIMVWPQVLARIDADKDGALSPGEISAYAERLQRDLSVAVNGKPLQLRLLASAADDVTAFGRGLGEIRLRFIADVPASESSRRLVFENKHEGAISSYLVNSLVPVDTAIRITAQKRNPQQSRYQLDYVQDAGSRSSADR